MKRLLVGIVLAGVLAGCGSSGAQTVRSVSATTIPLPVLRVHVLTTQESVNGDNDNIDTIYYRIIEVDGQCYLEGQLDGGRDNYPSLAPHSCNLTP